MSKYIGGRENREHKIWVTGLVQGAAMGVGITVVVFLFSMGAFTR